LLLCFSSFKKSSDNLARCKLGILILSSLFFNIQGEISFPPLFWFPSLALYTLFGDNFLRCLFQTCLVFLHVSVSSLSLLICKNIERIILFPFSYSLLIAIKKFYVVLEKSLKVLFILLCLQFPLVCFWSL
jgi:hypothetical protein